ncbi:MAG: hypothetical protein HC845_11700 [Akkermansiaceae bacterium]|nr:hypothetical protein [Akkermansiaceae bacterium]
MTPYFKSKGNSLVTTLVTTGRGNSGGPIWTRKNSKSPWIASGILVGGLPGETVVNAFSKNTQSFLTAVKPVLSKKVKEPVFVRGITSSSVFFPTRPNKTLPDGDGKQMIFNIPVRGFEDYDTTATVRLSLTIKTKHRGDLIGRLVAPSGATTTLFFNLFTQNGADGDDVIFRDFDLKALLGESAGFEGVPPNGTWRLIVEDSLKGDKAKVKNITLEVGVIENAEPPSVITPPTTTTTN